jgi:hypothetical protein
MRCLDSTSRYHIQHLRYIDGQGSISEGSLIESLIHRTAREQAMRGFGSSFKVLGEDIR